MTLLHRNIAPKPPENPDVPPHPGRRMSEAEFVKWCSDFWAEWVDGEVILMSPVNIDHAKVFGFLHAVLETFVSKHDLGLLLAEPYQVRLPSQRRRRSPDLFFVSREREDRVHYSCLEGPPDLILEIVSPDSESRDWRDKFNEYQAAGVPEYWIIDPASHRLEAYSLGRAKKYKLIPEDAGKIASSILPGFYLRPAWFATSKLPAVHQILKELGAL